MMHYTFTTIVVLLWVTLECSAINSVVKGKVYDNETKESLSGVYVIYGKNLGTTTDNNGNYFIRTDSVKLNIIFQFVGYETVVKTISLRSNDTVELNVGMVMKIREIDQIVVSANRTEQRISELTVTMDIIRPSILSDNHITDAQELINKTPGIEVMDGQASVRGGSGFSYGVGSRVLALIDGLPVLSADAGNIKWQFLPLENLSQIEIIKGASSVLYGSSALNGIINFRSADAGNIPATRFFTEAGIFGKPANKDWVWWDTPRFFSSASFSHLRKFGKTDFSIGSNLLIDEGYRRLNWEKLGRISLRLKHFSKKFENLVYGVNLNSGYTEKKDFVLWEDGVYGALKQDETTAVELHGDFVAVDPFISLKKSEKYKHDLRIRLQSARNRFPYSEKNNSDAFSIFSEYQGWYKLNDFLNITAGISENYNLVFSNFHGDHKGLNIAGFTQFEFSPFNRLKAVAGLRIEQNSLDGEKDKIVPVFRTGVNFQAADYTFLRASFGQGYRYPSIAEKHASTTLGSVRIFPNPDVQPESGWSAEAGIKQGISLGKMNGQADFSIFLSQNIDLIEYRFGFYEDLVTGEYDFGFMATNVEQSRVYGYEIEFILNRSSEVLNTTITGGYTFIYPVEFNKLTHQTTDIYLKYRRKHSGKISLNSTWKKLQLGLSLYVKSKILNIDNVFLHPDSRELILPGFYDYWNQDNKGYFLADGNLGYKITGNLDLSFVVKNITNTEYIGRPGDIQPQRNFSIRLSGKY
jgi:outer membrane receptor protein involved in Fe transport